MSLLLSFSVGICGYFVDLAMSGLLLDHLTMPDLLGADAIAAVVDSIVTTVVPEQQVD
jgi:hypothetical protein